MVFSSDFISLHTLLKVVQCKDSLKIKTYNDIFANVPYYINRKCKLSPLVFLFYSKLYSANIALSNDY